MSDQRNGRPPRLSMLYTWEQADYHELDQDHPVLSLTPSCHVLAFALEGSAELYWEGHYSLLTGKACALLPARSELRVRSASRTTLRLYIVQYHEIALPGNTSGASWPLTAGIIELASAGRFSVLVQRLYERRSLDGPLETHRNHILFQEMIWMLLKAAESQPEPDAAGAVRRTIAYMDNSFDFEMNHRQLAEMSGLSTRHYSRIFKSLTGKSPIEYLIALRMNHAKALLQTQELSVSEVAASAGFQDPFHFSRSFKQHTGVSPRLYLHLRKQSSRIASLQYMGELLALGITPAGAPSQLLRGGYWRHRVGGIAEIGRTVVTPYLDRLATLKPDVILTFDGYFYDDYTRIAPTLDMAWAQPVFDRFRFIADLIGKQQEAEEWLGRYEELVEEATLSLQDHIVPGQTVSFLWARGLPVSVQVYNDMKVFYEDLGFAAPAAVADMQRREDHRFKMDIPLQELPQYTGDYIFIVVSPDTSSQREFQTLLQHEAWLGLEAVKQGRVYVVSEDWLREDPVSMAGQVQDIVTLVTKQK